MSKNDKIIAEAKVHVEFKIKFELTQGEAMALDAIVGYGEDSFLKVFYEHMGKAYLQPYEQEMRNLFERVRGNLKHESAKIDAARKAINEALKDFK